ncbi:MAG: helix-turn-helix domain-containing protein, partial [Candidatus Eremiobacterota bacterium]
GEFLKEKREQAKLTISELSELTNISTAQISRLENNEHNPKLSTIQELSKVLKFSPNELPGSGYPEEKLELTDKKIIGFQPGIYGESTYAPSPENTSSPSIKEIIEETAEKTAFRVSEETINRIREKYRTPLFLQQFNELNELVKKGRQMEEIEKEDLPPGAIRMKVSTAKLPLVTGVKCGNFTCPTEETYEMISVPEEWIGKGDFVIEVSGDSMKECGICDKMHVLIKKQNICSPGDIVLICDYNETDISKGVLKKARNINDMGMVFINGSGDIIPLNENIRIEGKAVSVKGDL